MFFYVSLRFEKGNFAPAACVFQLKIKITT